MRQPARGSTSSAAAAVLRNNLSIIGAGNILTGITSSSVTNQAVFVLPQANNSPAISVHLEGFGVTPASGATTQIGADLECNSYTNSGMWYSTWDDVWFGNYANGFPGGGIKLSCPTPASAIQFSQFRNVVAFRSSGETNPALSICGSGVGNDQFYGGEFDAGTESDTTIVPNVFIGACPGDTGNAYSLNFYGTTMQGGTNLVELNGANNIQFDHTHHEGTAGLTNGFPFRLRRFAEFGHPYRPSSVWERRNESRHVHGFDIGNDFNREWFRYWHNLQSARLS